MKSMLKQREMVSILFIIALFAIVGAFNPQFLQFNNIFQIINNSGVYAIVAIGMCFVLFTGEIDVSIGAIVGLAAAVTGKLLNSGSSISFHCSYLCRNFDWNIKCYWSSLF